MTEKRRTTPPIAFSGATGEGQVRLVLRACALKALERSYDPAADLRTTATQMRDTAALVVAELPPPPPLDGSLPQSEVA